MNLFVALFLTYTTEAICGDSCLGTFLIIYPYMVPIRYIHNDIVLFPVSTRPECKCNNSVTNVRTVVVILAESIRIMPLYCINITILYIFNGNIFF